MLFFRLFVKHKVEFFRDLCSMLKFCSTFFCKFLFDNSPNFSLMNNMFCKRKAKKYQLDILILAKKKRHPIYSKYES